MSTRCAPLLLALGACAADLSPAPTASGTIAEPIIGGQTASTATYRTLVYLEIGADSFCTSTLVDKEWVLTAAHCVSDKAPGDVPVASLKLRFDDDNVLDAAGGKVVSVAEVHAHPGYVAENWDNDIALLKLAQPITDREPTSIHRTAVAPGSSLTILGWGDADNNGGGYGILRKLDTPTIDCTKTNDNTVSGANVLCFEAKDGTTSCYGDSGGPAMVNVNGKLEIVGASSGGTAETCTGGFDLYTAVAAEIDFVDKYVPARSGGGGGGGGSGGGGSGDGGGGGDGNGGGGSGSGGSGSTGGGSSGNGGGGASGNDGDSASSSISGGCSASGVPPGNAALLSLALAFGARRRRARARR